MSSEPQETATDLAQAIALNPTCYSAADAFRLARLVLAEEAEGFTLIGWMDNFGEAHGARIHEECDDDPPCLAIYRKEAPDD